MDDTRTPQGVVTDARGDPVLNRPDGTVTALGRQDGDHTIILRLFRQDGSEPARPAEWQFGLCPELAETLGQQLLELAAQAEKPEREH